MQLSITIRQILWALEFDDRKLWKIAQGKYYKDISGIVRFDFQKYVFRLQKAGKVDKRVHAKTVSQLLDLKLITYKVTGSVHDERFVLTKLGHKEAVDSWKRRYKRNRSY